MLKKQINYAKLILNLIAFSHSIFALPFALGSFIVAYKKGALVDLKIDIYLIAKIVLAIIFARAAAMTFNRIIDRQIDGKNPRTEIRELPSGKITLLEANLLLAACVSLFFLFAYLIGAHCLILAPMVMGLLLAYSYTKRVTYLSHIFLGLCLGLSAGGAWWVIRPIVEVAPLVLMSAVIFWVAGFDILYSCQDIKFDQDEGLYSIPAKFGLKKAFFISRVFHIAAAILLIIYGYSSDQSQSYYFYIITIIALLFYQHSIISPDNLKRIDRAFFTTNGLISLIFLIGIIYSNLLP